jgi:cellobiose phosphorylase
MNYKEFGEFDRKNREFVITRPDTPRPWINYLSNGEFCVLLSQTGGGYSFYLDPALNRITRWAPANYLDNRPGRYLYVRDEETGEVSSGMCDPCGLTDRFECRHGFGYSQIRNRYNGTQVNTTFFVPEGQKAEVWICGVKNTSRRARKVAVFPFMEWFLGPWEAELCCRNLTVLLNEGVYNEDLKAIWCGKFPWANKPWPYHAFMGSSEEVKGFDIDYEAFIGPEGAYENPRALRDGGCTGSVVRGNNMVGVLEHHFDLQPGEERRFVIVAGLADDPEDAQACLEAYRSVEQAESALAVTRRAFRKRVVDPVKIETPNEALNDFFNSWLKYQVLMNNHWGRSATFYHEGYGEFGYRNTAQDAWGMLPLDATYTRKRIITLLQHQRASGQPMAGWSYVAGASEGSAPADFPIWLPMLINGYIKETGDVEFLNRRVAYYDGRAETVYEHVCRAIQFLQDRARSQRGLPLMGTQDWNDAFDRTGIGGKGESVWLGMGLCAGLKELEELAAFIGDEERVQECRRRYEDMKALINQYAWVGDRYVYAFNDRGEPIGSPVNDEGGCQLNALTWAILADIPNEEQVAELLKHVDTTLDTPYGPALFAPPYTRYNPDIGRITAFAPGTKENAAVFIHACVFKIMMDFRLGRTEAAYETMQRILPNNPERDIAQFKTEPYVFPEYVIGPGNPRYGEGAFSWLTGSADWFLVAVLEKLLGLKTTYQGLVIDPHLPMGWERVRVLRVFRGTRFDIRISNPGGQGQAVVAMTVDEKPHQPDQPLPEFRDRRAHLVEVQMG